jgi:hypothetical protein
MTDLEIIEKAIRRASVYPWLEPGAKTAFLVMAGEIVKLAKERGEARGKEAVT